LSGVSSFYYSSEDKKGRKEEERVQTIALTSSSFQLFFWREGGKGKKEGRENGHLVILRGGGEKGEEGIEEGRAVFLFFYFSSFPKKRKKGRGREEVRADAVHFTFH